MNDGAQVLLTGTRPFRTGPRDDRQVNSWRERATRTRERWRRETSGLESGGNASNVMGGNGLGPQPLPARARDFESGHEEGSDRGA